MQAEPLALIVGRAIVDGLLAGLNHSRTYGWWHQHGREMRKKTRQIARRVRQSKAGRLTRWTPATHL